MQINRANSVWAYLPIGLLAEGCREEHTFRVHTLVDPRKDLQGHQFPWFNLRSFLTPALTQFEACPSEFLLKKENDSNVLDVPWISSKVSGKLPGCGISAPVSGLVRHLAYSISQMKIALFHGFTPDEFASHLPCTSSRSPALQGLLHRASPCSCEFSVS